MSYHYNPRNDKDSLFNSINNSYEANRAGRRVLRRVRKMVFWLVTILIVIMIGVFIAAIINDEPAPHEGFLNPNQSTSSNNVPATNFKEQW